MKMVHLMSASAIVGGLISKLVGGLDMAIQILCIVMVIDFATGLIVAGVFKKSGKSENGALSSTIGWKGLAKKVVTLFLVVIGNLLDKVSGTDFIRDAVIVCFTVNEVISVLENAGLMGIPIPAVITKAIDVLKADE